jgi:hypothetical protein
MKIVISACGVVGVIIASAAIFGTGVATADDYAGITYRDAKSKATAYKRTPVVATIVGGRLALDDCFVMSSQAGPWPKMMFNLSCVPLQASATTPGGSVGDAQTQEFKKQKDARDLEWKQSPDGRKWCVKTAAEHPEWVPIAGCDD